MSFDSIFTHRCVGSDKIPEGPRSGFQRDFDRLIFSSAFRRLQNKTQVFPLPGTAFVHNRLTHSLEVASVGRSLGKMIGEEISKRYRGSNDEAYEFYRYELANVVAAACLAHDIGNPAFGHSGEKAISAYFVDNEQSPVGGQPLRSFFNAREWKDLTSFEGNANAIRVLTQSYKGRFTGGFGLTYTTIASILKYPCESVSTDKAFKHRKKYGFFQAEKEIIVQVAEACGMIREQDDPVIFCRHPFVYLVEAADDICYSIVDMEDAHRLGILSTDTVMSAFKEVLDKTRQDGEGEGRTFEHYRKLEDANEGIAFLRARVINQLVQECSRVFLENQETILAGTFNNTLIDHLQTRTGALNTVQALSRARIYQHDTVLQIELAGYNLMSELLALLVPALLKSEPAHREEIILKLFPFHLTGFREAEGGYAKVLLALDYLSGMTDEYATEIYRRLKGISTPVHG
ncbi:MAG: dNTP triphosphohydrolase [Chitinophagaceae bacterium]|nr:MAG: dNTP triphosphohydrolase [Chitinophagaceae bacterium]